MQINADFTQPALVHPSSTSGWPHPRREVERICSTARERSAGGPPASCATRPTRGFCTTSTLRVKKFWCCRVFSEGDHHYPRAGTQQPGGLGPRPRNSPRAPLIFVSWGICRPPQRPAGTSLRINTHDTACWATEGGTLRASCTATPMAHPAAAAGAPPPAACWPHGKPKPSSSKAARTAQPTSCRNVGWCACRRVLAVWNAGAQRRYRAPQKALHPHRHSLSPMPQTSMTSTRIAILGGASAACWQPVLCIAKASHDFVLLEARSAWAAHHLFKARPLHNSHDGFAAPL